MHRSTRPVATAAADMADDDLSLCSSSSSDCEGNGGTSCVSADLLFMATTQAFVSQRSNASATTISDVAPEDSM